MKVSTLFKYIFIIFTIGIIIYAGYKIYDKNNNPTNVVEISENKEEEIIKDIRLAICNYDSMNPLITNNREILNIDNLIFEPLFTITKDYQLEPCLATEWSKTGDNTYVVKVDTTVKWQDGAYLTAKDVQFTIDRLKEGNSIYKANVANITGVEVVDSSTVKITLDSEVSFFEYNLTFPIMSNMYYYNEDFYSSSKIPIGTGRFKITDISSTSISLVKNENWKRASKEQSRIDTIKINVYSSMGEVFNSFKLGNVDLINTKTQNYQDYIGTIGFTITESAGREFDFVGLNCADEILQDKYVRQAISYAIDKDNIVSAVYNNQKITAYYPLDYGNYLYSMDSTSSGYNADQAKKILEENGWTYANNRWRKNINGSTKTLRLKLAVSKSNASRVSVAEIIKQQLENIGISVTINQLSDEQYQSALNNKDYQLLITGVYNSYSPDLSYFFGENNIFNYKNEDMLSIINSGISTKNTNGLKENYSKMLNTYKDEMPFIGLYRNKNITITSNSLIGEVATNNYSSFYNVASWYRK
jgi:peptide/nickel transport system substrate-binding protein